MRRTEAREVHAEVYEVRRRIDLEQAELGELVRQRGAARRLLSTRVSGESAAMSDSPRGTGGRVADAGAGMTVALAARL